MNDETRVALEQLGTALLEGSTEAITQVSASWLHGNAIEQLQRSLREKEQQIREDFSDMNIGQAESYDIDENHCTFEDLKDDGVNFPEEVNSTNFVQWACVSIQADDGEWSLGDLWCAVVEEDSTLKIGYYEVQDPD